jgi:hypothetical protein
MNCQTFQAGMAALASRRRVALVLLADLPQFIIRWFDFNLRFYEFEFTSGFHPNWNRSFP